MYKKIKQHTNSHELYVQKLLGEGSVSQVGEGRVVEGWDEGVMQCGTKRLLLGRVASKTCDHLLAMRGGGGGGGVGPPPPAALGPPPPPSGSSQGHPRAAPVHPGCRV